MFEGSRALRPGVLSAAAAGRRHAQRIDQSRSDQLLGGRADRRARPGAVDGVGPDGISAAGADPREVRKPARRRAQRAAAELREPPVRAGRHGDFGCALSARSSVSLADDRLGRRSARDALDEVREFFATYYHPANASLTLAGDIDAGTRLPSRGASTSAIFRPAPARARCAPTAALDASERGCCSKIASSCRGSTSRGIRPAMFGEDDAELDLAADLLAHGKTSRLYRSLVYEKQIAADVVAYQHSREISGVFQIAPTAAPGVALQALYDVIIRDARASLAGTGRRRRARARACADRRAVRLSHPDDRRLRRQVRSAERVQRLPRRPRVLSPRIARATTARRRRDRERPSATGWSARPHVALSVVPRGSPRSRSPARPRSTSRESRRSQHAADTWSDRVASAFPRFIAACCRTASTSARSRTATFRSCAPCCSFRAARLPIRPTARGWRRSRPTCSTKAAPAGRRSRSRIALARYGADLDVDVGPDAIVLALTTLTRFRDAGTAPARRDGDDAESGASPTSSASASCGSSGCGSCAIMRRRSPSARSAGCSIAIIPTAISASGTEAALAATTESGHQTAFTAARSCPAAATLVIAGDADVDDAVAAAADAFGQLGDGGRSAGRSTGTPG